MERRPTFRVIETATAPGTNSVGLNGGIRFQPGEDGRPLLSDSPAVYGLSRRSVGDWLHEPSVAGDARHPGKGAIPFPMRSAGARAHAVATASPCISESDEVNAGPDNLGTYA